MNQKMVIVGATSAIAQAMAKQLAESGHELFLIARDEAHLNMVADDVAIRSQKSCKTALFDAMRNDQIQSCVIAAVDALNQIDVVIIAHGTLPDQQQCQHDLDKTLDEFQVNATSYIGLLTAFGMQLEKQKSGTLVVFSSCAGDRGRASNYLYGSAKAAIATFCAGLRAYLFQHGVHVLIVKPGFVDTPMTRHLKKNFLWANPDDVARRIIKAMRQKKYVVYVPWFWRYIMMIIKWLPEKMMRKL